MRSNERADHRFPGMFWQIVDRHRRSRVQHGSSRFRGWPSIDMTDAQRAVRAGRFEIEIHPGAGFQHEGPLNGDDLALAAGTPVDDLLLPSCLLVAHDQRDRHPNGDDQDKTHWQDEHTAHD